MPPPGTADRGTQTYNTVDHGTQTDNKDTNASEAIPADLVPALFILVMLVMIPVPAVSRITDADPLQHPVLAMETLLGCTVLFGCFIAITETVKPKTLLRCCLWYFASMTVLLAFCVLVNGH